MLIEISVPSDVVKPLALSRVTISLMVLPLLYHLPEDEIEALAKCFLPDILDFFESEEGRQEFEQWKKEQSNKDT